MLPLGRRELMATVVSAAALATLPASAARALSPLDKIGLENLVYSQRERTRLYQHMDLMNHALMLYIFNQDGLETEDFSKSKGGVEWEQNQTSFYAWFKRFDEVDFLIALLDALGSGDANELIENATNRAENLVGKVGVVLTEIGIGSNGTVGSEALRGITTMEQLNALENAGVPEKPFLCGFFPFSYFCD